MQVPGHITNEMIEGYRLRRLPAAELLAAHTHAAACQECRARLAGATDLDSALAKVRADFAAAPGFADEPEHLSYEQLAAYVDGADDDVEREIAESHLAVCRECAGDAADLRGYQSIVAGAEDAPPGTPSSVQPARSFWQRLSSFNLVASFGVVAPAAVAATLVAAVLIGLWLASRTTEESADGQVARVQPTAVGGNVPPQTGPDTILDGAGNSAPAPSPQAVSQPTPQRSNVSATEREDSPARPERKSPVKGSTSPAPTALEVALNDGGGRVVFDSRGHLRGLDNLPRDARRSVRRSLETQRAETPRALDTLTRGASGVLMSGQASSGVAFALVEPVGKVVRDDSPSLRWRPLPAASGYKVAVVDSSFRVVAESESVTATEWTPPAPLPRGQTYYWQVTATLADGGEVTSPATPAPQAKFRVLDERASADLKLLEEAAPDSHLARGVLYARAGLLAEAEAEFQKLVSLNPRSPVARKLLRSVRRK